MCVCAYIAISNISKPMMKSLADVVCVGLQQQRAKIYGRRVYAIYYLLKSFYLFPVCIVRLCICVYIYIYIRTCACACVCVCSQKK